MPQTGQAYPVVPPFRRPMRRADEIDDDVFHILEQEFDSTELPAQPPGRDEIVES
ncbi:hypothetical protein [Rhizobium leguminosarum]|uniref:hypothetical protein n=1 Tax=Rhizobium leguminosarum TaxID=384 RepID=UPI001FE12334|nr:hypothetical protein [Rhizobium leguminosarum]